MQQAVATKRAWERGAARIAALPDRTANWLVAAALTAAAIIMTLLLVIPDRTVVTQHLYDLMIFLDAAHRIGSGQIPNHDFHSAQGPFAYTLLAIGYAWSGSFGGMMPATTGLFMAILLPFTIYACLSRLTWPLALLFGLHILILSAAPFYIGDITPRPTWGMFYNRWGWALISLLFLFVLPRRARFGGFAADALCIGLLWLILFYLKITYAVVAAPFLLGLLVFPHARRAALGSFAVIVVVGLAVQLLWGGTFTYIDDIRLAASATGAVRNGLIGIFATLYNNAWGVYLVAAVLLLALYDRIRYDYLLMCLFMAATGIILDRHNSQGPGLLTFVTAALVAVLAPRRARRQAPGGDGGGDTARPVLASLLLAGALAVPIDVAGAGNLAFHALAAVRGRAPGQVGLAGIITPAPPTSSPNQPSALLARRAGGTCGPVDPGLLNIDAHPGETEGKDVLAILRNGVSLLDRTQGLAGKVFLMDVANPFNALTDRGSPVGAEAFNDAEVSLSEDVHRPADAMLGDVDVLMVPRYPQKYATFDLLRRVYRPYFDANFALTARSECWDAYRRVTAKPLSAPRPARS